MGGFQFIPTIIALALLAIIIFKIPEIGLVLCLIIGSLAKGIIQPFLGSIDITVYLFFITYGAIIVRSLMERKVWLPDFITNIGILLLIAFLLISLFYTPEPVQGIEIFLRFVLLTVSLLYATFMWCNNVTRIKRLFFVLVIILLAYSSFAFIWIFLLGQDQPKDTRAPFAETPVLGIAQLLAATILITFILRAFVRSRWKKNLLLLLVIIGIVELIALNSRGPMLAFIITAACLFIFHSAAPGKRLAIISGIALVILCAFAFLPSDYTDRYARLFVFDSPSVAARLNMWIFVVNNFNEWFFTGAGISGFNHYYYYVPMGIKPLTRLDPHNIFMDVFVSAGFFALIIFISLMIVLLYKGILVSRSSDPSFHILGLAAIIALIYFIIAGLFSMSIIGTRPLWFFGGVILALYRLSLNKPAKTMN